MHTICLLAFVTIVVVVRADQDRPRVAWVPIESRNISEVVSKALEGSEERLVRIGKMLSDSYDKMARDTEEGQAKIRQLEDSNTSVGATVISTVIMSLLSLGFVHL
ncbi:hypothetical protein Y032_0268g790 [Ancylostoma ceylanicum]|uniref:SXP/RAL-2 family protein Ani s 5-like cation-binding domain-containing protein n=1 Tax=Ancylostoma ceylanicum TaxID=53326 RepID=A0A016S8Z1_9BILA|nr:hypothetical protein Y032_0268g790 [Ancylostoma ceylanicum]